MNSSVENIEALSRAILNEAHAETGQVKAQAQSKADSIRQRAREQAEAERKAILQQASQEAERLRSQAIATTQLKARALELEHREKLLERVFKAVRQRLPSLQQRADYDQIAIQLIREALAQLGATKAEIRADKSTEKLLTSQVLDMISKEMKVQLSIGKSLEQGTGVIVEASDGHLHFDNTLETRLIRLQNVLRSSVYRTLMGESA